MESNKEFKIFVVDDDPLVHKILSHFFTKHDEIGDVDYFDNGLRALERLENFLTEDYPNAILLDLNMPILDGFGFLEKINELKGFNPRTQIVILSTSTRSPDMTMCLSNERVRDYFAKPLKREDITKLIDYMKSA